MCLPLATCVQEMVRRGEILDDDMEDEFYLRRLDAGLFVLQLICYIMVEINNSGISQVHTFTDTPTLASRRTRRRFFFWCPIRLKPKCVSSIFRTPQVKSYFKLPLLIWWFNSFSPLLIHFALQRRIVRKSWEDSNLLKWIDILLKCAQKAYVKVHYVAWFQRISFSSLETTQGQAVQQNITNPVPANQRQDGWGSGWG